MYLQTRCGKNAKFSLLCVCGMGKTVFCLLFIIAVPRWSHRNVYCVFVGVCDKEYRREMQTGHL
jgi:hypothetical protein